MKLRIVSDLHLEHEQKRLPIMKNEDKQTLILAGDITPNYNMFDDFLLDCSYRFKNVIFVYGNHEYYGHGVFDTKERFNEIISNYANVFVLDNELLVLDDIRIFGGTLWGEGYQEECQYLNDFNVVNYPDDFYYNEYLDFIDNYKGISENIDVVISHHSPSYLSLNPRYAGSFMNKYFMNNLDHLIEQGINLQYWIHGHTHDSVTYDVGDCKVICNPKGYFNENRDFDPKLVVDVKKSK